MAQASKDQILIHFMECTSLQDVDECVAILNQCDWDILNAIEYQISRSSSGQEREKTNATVPKHPKPPTTSTASQHRHKSIVKRTISSDEQLSDDVEGDNEVTFVRTVSPQIKSNKPTTGLRNGSQDREIQFDVEYLDRKESIKISDSLSIQYLRQKINDKFHVSPGSQRFVNWENKKYDDRTILKNLNLPKINTIHLVKASSSISNGAAQRSPSQGASSRIIRNTTTSSHTTHSTTESNFSIVVEYEDNKGTKVPYQLHLSPKFTIRQMKEEIERVSGIPIREQLWPDLTNVTDTHSLKQAFPHSKNTLKLRRKQSSPQRTPNKTRSSSLVKKSSQHSDDDVMEIDSPSSVRPYRYDDVIDNSPPHGIEELGSYESTRELLIPEKCTDETAGIENFTRVFHFRYNSTGPILFVGTLDKAIQESLFSSPYERRPLLIYLHNDRAISANVFCTRVLCSEAIIEFLVSNFVVWAWDFTSDSNRSKFFETFKRVAGSRSAQSVSQMELESFPIMIVLHRNRGSVEISTIIEGKLNPNDVIQSLTEINDAFLHQRRRDIEEENERKTRENLKQEQEFEYNESIKADLAKEQARKAELQKIEDEKLATQALERKRQKEQHDSKTRLPAEPAENEPNLARFKIRLPDQGVLMRRFRLQETLQTLFDYLSSEGKIFGEYKLITTYPKRDLTTLNRNDTFEHLKLYPQEQLILESL